MRSDSQVYFAAKESKQTAGILMNRSSDWFQTLQTNGYLNKLIMMYDAYHGHYYADGNLNRGNGHTITFGGEQGELVQLGVNHIRNLAQHMLNMITATRPSMEARSVNSDYDSLVQTRLANSLLDFYMKDFHLEEYLKTAVEYAIVFGSGYVKLEWNATRGDVYDTDPVTGDEIREGDMEFSNLSPFDVVFDDNREDKRHDWVITRTSKNKFDLAAKFPELADKIVNIASIGESINYTSFSFTNTQTDHIPVYEFYHKRTEALPDGRYMLYLDSDLILLDSPMPYEELPVYSIAPSYYLGTGYGYTPMFDLLGMQDAVNSIYSAILTNQTAFAVQSIVIPKGSDLDVTSFQGGMQVLEANNSELIRPLQLTQSPKESFEYLQILEKSMETISGINSVARGNPDPNLRSGNALALIQSMTLQFMSGLQQSYVNLIEDLGSGIIQTLKNHATVPRMANIAGENNQTYVEEFKGDDLSTINRVKVSIGNPLSRTTAGRVEMAESMLQMGLITRPEQYLAVIDTGNLDTLTQNTQKEIYAVKSENEMLVKKQKVRVLLTDRHQQHIDEHAAILSDPKLRYDDQLVASVLEHIQEHIDVLSNPAVAQILITLGQQPIAPPQAPPPQAPPQQDQPNQQNDIKSSNLPPPTQDPLTQEGPSADQQPNFGGAIVPTQLVQDGSAPQRLPKPAKVDGNLLANPSAQQQSLGNVK